MKTALPSTKTLDFKDFLQEDLLRRCQTNPSYSLRAYARLLKIEASALSKILNGKRQITTATFRKLSERLALTPQQAARYEPKTLKRTKAALPRQTPAYRELSVDAFEAIADWFHYAILELTTVENFRSEPRWVARTLGITVSQVNIAVERLQRLGMLEIKDGVWTDVSHLVTGYRDNFTNHAFRSFQAQVLRMALAALETVPVSERDQSSMTMAIDSRRLPEAKERIKEFRRGLCEFLQGEGARRDGVYHLSLSLYPVNQSDKQEFHV